MFIHAHAYAGDRDKIGVVDFKEFMDRSIAGIAVQSQIKQKGKKLKSELEQAEAGLKRLHKRYKDEVRLWNKAQKIEKEKQLKNKVRDFRMLAETKKKEFNEFKFKIVAGLQEEILKYVEKLAAEKEYLLIIEKQSGRVLFSHSTIDATSDLIKNHDRLERAKK